MNWVKIRRFTVKYNKRKCFYKTDEPENLKTKTNNLTCTQYRGASDTPWPNHWSVYLHRSDCVDNNTYPDIPFRHNHNRTLPQPPRSYCHRKHPPKPWNNSVFCSRLSHPARWKCCQHCSPKIYCCWVGRRSSQTRTLCSCRLYRQGDTLGDSRAEGHITNNYILHKNELERKTYLLKKKNKTETHRRPEIVAYLVGQSELRHFRRHPTVIVDEGYDAGVEGTFRRLVHASYGFRVRFVPLAYAARGARSARYPRQP